MAVDMHEFFSALPTPIYNNFIGFESRTKSIKLDMHETTIILEKFVFILL